MVTYMTNPGNQLKLFFFFKFTVADESPIVSEDDNVKKDFEGLMFKRQVLPRHSSPSTENKPIVTTQVKQIGEMFKSEI